MLARRHPAWSAWCLVFTGIGAMIAGQGFVTPSPGANPMRYEKWLQKKGSGAVTAVLAEIGSGVEVPSVRAQPINPLYIGLYTPGDDGVTFNSEYEYLDYELMDLAAHECVHAIFDQQGLVPKRRDAYFSMVNETAASVLGAYIAGDVWSRQGKDGAVMTEVFFQSYRRVCDPENPRGVYAEYLAPGRPQSGEFTRENWHSILIHYAPLQLVDEVDEICRRKPDPIDAAKAIAERFMRIDLQSRDMPILEEFRRRQREWPADRF